MKAAPRAEFPHYTLEERAAAFIRGYRDGRDRKDRSTNCYGTIQPSLRNAWDAGWIRAHDKVKTGLDPYGQPATLRRPRLIVTFREAMAWARRSA